MNLVFKTLPSPVGELIAVANQNALCGLLWPESEDRRFADARRISNAETHVVFDLLECQLNEYFEGVRQSFDIPLEPKGTEFQQEAWQALTEIPFGETRTYAQQAMVIGRPDAVRAVGGANSRNPISIVIPCHRVIGASGKLTGFAGGLKTKKFLLDHEASVSNRILF